MTHTRITVTIDKEHLAIYQRMAAAGNQSLSRCVGEWLADTVDSAQFVVNQMERARAAPKLVMRELVAASGGLHADLKTLTEELRQRGFAVPQDGRAAPSVAPSGGLTPPLSNTGVKVPKKGKK